MNDYRVIDSEQVIPVDVDDTLVLWKEPEAGDKTVVVACPYSNKPISLVKHEGHIKVLMDRKARGAFIIVWSAAGNKWADAVVEALGLKDHVNLALSKPIMYIDDKEANSIMGERLYLQPESRYGKQ